MVFKLFWPNIGIHLDHFDLKWCHTVSPVLDSPQLALSCEKQNTVLCVFAQVLTKILGSRYLDFNRTF